LTINFNTTFDGYNSGGSFDPVYFVQISGAACDYSSKFVTAAKKVYLSLDGSLSQDVDPAEGKSTIGEFSFRLADIGGDITALVKEGNHLRENNVKLFAGFNGMTAGDFEQIWTGKINNITKNGLDPEYKFDCVDIQKFVKQKIYQDATADAVAFTTSGNPITILLETLMTSKTAGLNHATYDLGNKQGLRISSADIDVATFEDIRDTWFPSYDFKFRFKEPVDNGKEWIEEQINKPLGCYFKVTSDGKLSYACANPPLPGDTLKALYETSMEVGDFDFNYDSVITEVYIKSSWRATGDNQKFFSHDFYQDVYHYRVEGKTEPLVLECKGIHSTASPEGSHNAGTIKSAIKTRIFDRYAVPKPKLSATLTPNHADIEIGDIVSVTHSKVPNIRTGVMGLTDEWFECISKSHNLADGNIEVELLGTNFGNFEKYGLISPSQRIPGLMLTSVNETANTTSVVVLSTTIAYFEGFHTGDYVQFRDGGTALGSGSITEIYNGGKGGIAASLLIGSAVHGIAQAQYVEFGDYTSWQANQMLKYAAISGLGATYHMTGGGSHVYIVPQTASIFTAHDKVRLESTSGSDAYTDRTLLYSSGSGFVIDNDIAQTAADGKHIAKHLCSLTASTQFTAQAYSII
jgi:hypothetical protein